MTFVDNAVDPTTGTIRLKATFPNEEKRLWPGQFANVTLTLATEPDAHRRAVAGACRRGQQGAYVFVVKPDSTVETRRVTIARTQGSETIIAKGLQAGEKVVTDGQPRLTQARRSRFVRQVARAAAGRAVAGGRARRVENGRRGLSGRPAPSVPPVPDDRLAPRLRRVAHPRRAGRLRRTERRPRVVEVDRQTEPAAPRPNRPRRRRRRADAVVCVSRTR